MSLLRFKALTVIAYRESRASSRAMDDLEPVWRDLAPRLDLPADAAVGFRRVVAGASPALHDAVVAVQHEMPLRGQKRNGMRLRRGSTACAFRDIGLSYSRRLEESRSWAGRRPARWNRRRMWRTSDLR